MEVSDSPSSIPPHFVSFAWRYRRCAHCWLPRGEGTFARGPGRVDLPAPTRRLSAETMGSPRFLGVPWYGYAVVHVPGRAPAPGQYGVGVLSPLGTTATTSATRTFRGSIPRPSHSLSTLRSARCRDTTQDSLPAGGQPLPGGIRTRRAPFRRFQVSVDVLSTSSVLLLQAYPGARYLAPTLGRVQF